MNEYLKQIKDNEISKLKKEICDRNIEIRKLQDDNSLNFIRNKKISINDKGLSPDIICKMVEKGISQIHCSYYLDKNSWSGKLIFTERSSYMGTNVKEYIDLSEEEVKNILCIEE